MKATIINTFISAIGLLNISFLLKGLNDAFGTDASWISKEGENILNNPEDKRKVEEAVSELKKGNAIEPVQLSDGRIINIRIN